MEPHMQMPPTGNPQVDMNSGVHIPNQGPAPNQGMMQMMPGGANPGNYPNAPGSNQGYEEWNPEWSMMNHPSHHSHHAMHQMTSQHPAAMQQATAGPNMHHSNMVPSQPPNMHMPGPGMTHASAGGMHPGNPNPNHPHHGHHPPPPQHMQHVGGYSGGYPVGQAMVYNQSNAGQQPVFVCGNCHKEIMDKDHPVQCEAGCKFWYHGQCSGLTLDAIAILRQENFVEWICHSCVMKVPHIPYIKYRT